jgi:hypothetical protein
MMQTVSHRHLPARRELFQSVSLRRLLAALLP